jgi:hypothetical protein
MMALILIKSSLATDVSEIISVLINTASDIPTFVVLNELTRPIARGDFINKFIIKPTA